MIGRNGQVTGIVIAVAVLIAPLPSPVPAHADEPLTSDVRDLLPRLFLPIPPSTGLDPGKVSLGERLFHDPVLSSDSTIACASCHDLATGGADGKPLSTGIGGHQTRRNAPTVFNAALLQHFFWDGRAETLENQIDGPIKDKNEMASDWPVIVERLSRDPAYRQAFDTLYGGSISEATIKDALVQYERSLNTPGSRFDIFLSGDESALSQAERNGLSHFVRLGCASCHQGVLLGANLFQKFGVYRDRADGGGAVDLGRYAVTHQEYDKFVFKVPGLRNVALTAPYFHDGSAPDLQSAVQTMARLQLNKTLDERVTSELVAFLKTLTGKLPVRPLTAEVKR